MIRLAGSQVKVFTSPSFTHPVLSGTSSVVYNINHNLGKIPDLVKYYWDSSETAANAMRHDFYSDGSNFGGISLGLTTATSLTFNGYRLAGVAQDFYVKVFVLDENENHN